MTSKERAEKRAQANNMEPLFQLGKVKVLRDTSPLTPREAANRIAEATGSEAVIGGSMIFYRYSKKLHENKKKKK